MRNYDPGLAPLTRALLEGIPTFAALKTDGVKVEEITAAFKGWDSAVDDNLIAATVKRLVADPVIEVVRSGNASQPPTCTQDLPLAICGINTQLTEIKTKLDTLDDIREQMSLREDDPSFTVPQVAEKLHVSRTKVYRLTETGQLKSYKTGNQVRVKASHIREYQERHGKQVVDRAKKKRRSFDKDEANRLFGAGWDD
jgi:excisionase family DNA binding protein